MAKEEGRSDSSSSLLAAWKAIALKCGEHNKTFMQCKASHPSDPAACLAAGSAVEKCVLSTLFDLKSGACGASFAKYVSCIDTKGQAFDRCRKEQALFEDCALPAASPSS